MPPSKILCSKSAQVIEISCHAYGSELQGMERVQLIEAKVRAPGLLTEWALVPASVSTSCHSQNLPSHIYVLLGSGISGRAASPPCSRGLFWANRGGSNHRSHVGQLWEQRNCEGHHSSRWQDGAWLKERIHSVVQPFLFALNFSMKWGRRSRRESWRKKIIKTFKQTVLLLWINNS